MPSELEYDLPKPEYVHHAIDVAEVSMDIYDHDDFGLKGRRPPGGGFAFEISETFSYAGYDCRHVLTLDRDGAEELTRALVDALDWEVIDDAE